MSGITVLVCGGRDMRDYGFISRHLTALHSRQPIGTVVHGGARGVDSYAATWALYRLIPTLEFKADWKKHGRAAGPIRNRQMLAEGRPDLVVAFPGGRGTADMARAAREAGVEVIEIAPTIETRRAETSEAQAPGEA